MNSNVNKIIAYEQGELSQEDTIKLFQELIDSGQAWQLQGAYGRTAKALLDAGYCVLGPKGYRDAYGNKIPGKDEVEPGTLGSQEYADRKRAEYNRDAYGNVVSRERPDEED